MSHLLHHIEKIQEYICISPKQFFTYFQIKYFNGVFSLLQQWRPLIIIWLCEIAQVVTHNTDNNKKFDRKNYQSPKQYFIFYQIKNSNGAFYKKKYHLHYYCITWVKISAHVVKFILICPNCILLSWLYFDNPCQ